ncbi:MULTISPECIES: LrgB family protein [Bacillaceae]|uniref:LrgB family protein n=1 Tax=Bacillaceae TaxID=186817 RepID=UPI000BFDA88F|nr:MULTISPECIES: LrgB family protein [Bacillaceae]PGT91161.1 hypothetical protein COD11_01375 [Bacillus sp. AFS040349]UGB29856.1 LrgB family protein [Metabacillus sp. B2-18]
MTFLIGLFFILITLLIYSLMRRLYTKFSHPILVPIFTSSLIIVIILLIAKISYSSYMIGGQWIEHLLGPAVVAFAIPLFDHREILKRNILSIFTSVFIGALIGVCSGIIMSLLTNVDEKLLRSLAPKSVTTPIAMDISEMVGGTPTLAAVYVMIAGISGAMFGPYLMNLFKIKQPISRGIGFGTASHGIGTARALEMGTVEGAISSISMTLSAIFTSILCPILLSLFL